MQSASRWQEAAVWIKERGYLQPEVRMSVLDTHTLSLNSLVVLVTLCYMDVHTLGHCKILLRINLRTITSGLAPAPAGAGGRGMTHAQMHFMTNHTNIAVG